MESLIQILKNLKPDVDFDVNIGNLIIHISQGWFGKGYN